MRIEAKFNQTPLIPIVILKTPEVDRSTVLEESLRNKKCFKIELVKSTMAKTFIELEDFFINYDLEEFNFLEGRELMPSEIACANSHNIARNIIANTPYGGIILEDDARFLNLDSLYFLVLSFLQNKKGKKAILNLTGFKNKSVTSLNFNRIQRLLGAPDLAVGYALTPHAAVELTRANSPIKYVADWPDSKCRFYVPINPLVKHGDENTSSIIVKGAIDPRNADKKKLIELFFCKVLKASLTNHRIGFMKYLRYQFLRRIYFHLDSFVLSLRIRMNS